MSKSYKEKLERNIWKFHAYNIIGGFMLFLPVIVLFWQENGLSLTQIMTLQSLFSISTIILEIPTGYLADVYGRKKTLLLASFTVVAAIIMYSISHGFYGFLAAELVWGVSIALMSGADSAFLYDTLKELGREKEYKKLWGMKTFYGFIAMTIASIIGGFIGNYSFRWTFYAMIPIIALLIPLTLSFKEPRVHKPIVNEGYARDLINIMKNNVWNNKKVFWMTAYSCFVIGFNWSAWALFQPYMKETGVKIIYFGIIYAGFGLFAALASKYAHDIEESIGERYTLILMALLVPIGLLLMGKIIFLYSFIFILAQQFVWGFSEPIISDYLNKLTPSNVRATVLSIKNMILRIFYAILLPIVGWISDAYSITQALTVLGITSLISGVTVLVILHKKRVI